MAIRVCVAGATGWTGSAVARKILASTEFQLTGAVARKTAGLLVGDVLGVAQKGPRISASVPEALAAGADVLIDYTAPDAVKGHVMTALEGGVRVVVGSSGLAASDFAEIAEVAKARSLGVIAAGNFSITAALAKHFALLAARHLPSWEIIDYADARKADAPSGTTRELAEEIAKVARPRIERPVEETLGVPEARGAGIEGTRVHSVRLPSFVISFETIFGLPDERLTIRHDAGTGAEPYVAGTLFAAREVLRVEGLVRGLDRLLFA